MGAFVVHLDDVLDDPAVLRPDEAAARLGRSLRTVQRLARRWIGLPPTAVLRRRRLQEALERWRTDPSADLADVAADLGYADHARSGDDVRTVLGTTPSDYRRQVAMSTNRE